MKHLNTTFRQLLGLALAGVLASPFAGPASADALAPVSVGAAPGSHLANQKLDYNRDVQPILSNACYQCHGPDTGSRKAGLRLDLRDAAMSFVNKAGVKAIVPGDPDHSELVRRTESHDPDELMPKNPDKRLTPAQIKLLREWIAQGAEFRDHWAFEKPVKAPLPEVNDKAWGKNAIDAFVLARLERDGLHPNPEADRRTLIRRVTLDLTGLLPTPEEVDSFVADASPNAYEKVVDRLLASPRYGEHRARYWMDYSRFGDTSGLHVDGYTMRWPYRDYVINAFNANKPFDQFTREQLAGDLLPPENVDQLVATGFVRNGISSGEGGTIIEELRCNNKRERAEAFGAVYMGMSTGCAVCHDHKYDPLTTKDFYSLTAFFNNIAEKSANDDRAEWPPNIVVPTAKNREAYNAVMAKKAAIQRQLNAIVDHLPQQLTAWQAKGNSARPVSPEKLTLRLRLDENPKLGSAESVVVHNTAPGASPAVIHTTGSKPNWGEETWLWPTFRMDSNTLVPLGHVGDVESNQAFSCGMWVRSRNVPGGEWGHSNGAFISSMDIAKSYKGWNIYYSGGPVAIQLVGAWPNDRIQINSKGGPAHGPFDPPEGYNGNGDGVGVPRGMWHHLCFTYDGSAKAAGLKLYIDGAPQETTVEMDALTGSIKSGVTTWLGRRHDGEPLQETAYQDVRIYHRALTADEVARLPREDYVAEILAKKPAADQATGGDKTWTPDERKVIGDWFLSVDEDAKALSAQIPTLDAELVKLSKGGNLTLVCREKANTLAYADVLTRGSYSARAERVLADTPHFLPPMPKGAPHNRLGLAEWVLAPENPLTSRVAVNRMWQELFGIGIVETSEDFGIVGDRPSNAALLDYLAVDFRENNWDIKRLYKTLVMSATYRQSSKALPDIVQKDPKNRLLAHGPRFRMEGEMIRDTALQSAGLLVEQIGGPSVKPYQPSGIWELGAYPSSNTRNYTQDHGGSLYRRSLYTFWKRMAPMPNLEVFDATDRSGFCVRRQRTNTPLQALTLLNDPQYLEAARLLGVRALKTGGSTTDDRIQFLGRTLLAHPFDAVTLSQMRNQFAKFSAELAGNESAAKELLTVGETPADKELSANDQAVWMLMASTVMNSDEAINK